MTTYWPRRSTGLPPGQRLLTEMPRFSDDPLKPPPPMEPIELVISIEGEVVAKLTEADLTAIGMRTLESDFHCVTTWSVKGLKWEGVPLADVIRSVGIDSDAGAYVKAKAADRAHAHFMFEDAMAPDVLLATHLNGEPLGPRHGGPLRLVASAHYGYKNIKHLTGLDFRNNNPSRLGKMHLRGRVAQEERHPRFPNWLVRLPYRLMIAPTAYLGERALRTQQLASSGEHRIDEHLPDYDFTEHHHIDLDGSPAEVYDVARHLDFSNSSITRRLLKLRGIDFAALSIEAMTAEGEHFKVIDEDSPREYVIGMIGDGRNPTQIRDAQQFRDFRPRRGVKIAWNFRTEPLGDGRTRLHTETRTKCFGRATKAVFSVYWLVVKPFSGLIRREMLKAARNQLAVRETV